MLAPLTPAGEATIAELAQRYRVSDDAVRGLLDGVICGGGTMAQFSHPDLGGSGQWMRGGMTMVGDMFNPGLQATVSGICSELATQVAAGAVLISSPEGASAGSGALTGFGGGDSWWPAELGRPSSSGVQNDAAYAYFPVPRLLAIRRGQKVTVHDTGDHAISGVQQQQGGRGSLEFTSQLGSFTVDTLPVVRAGGGGQEPATIPATTRPAAESPVPTSAPTTSAPTTPVTAPAGTDPNQPAPETWAAAPVAPRASAAGASPAGASAAGASPAGASPAGANPAGASTAGSTTAGEIGAAIETLAGLRDKGHLTADEFTAKKTELLGRL